MTQFYIRLEYRMYSDRWEGVVSVGDATVYRTVEMPYALAYNACVAYIETLRNAPVTRCLDLLPIGAKPSYQ